MPPDKPKLPEDVIADFVKWIELGAPIRARRDAITGESWPHEAREHWAFQPIKAPAIGRGVGSAGSLALARPIDAFILAKLADAAGSQSPPASAAAS